MKSKEEGGLGFRDIHAFNLACWINNVGDCGKIQDPYVLEY